MSNQYYQSPLSLRYASKVSQMTKNLRLGEDCGSLWHRQNKNLDWILQMNKSKN